MPRPSSKVVARRFRASSSETHERSSARSRGAPRVVVARASRGARLRVFSTASRRSTSSFSDRLADRLWFSVSARPISEAYLEVQAGPRRALRRRLAHAQRRERGGREAHTSTRARAPLSRRRAPLSRRRRRENMGTTCANAACTRTVRPRRRPARLAPRAPRLHLRRLRTTLRRGGFEPAREGSALPRREAKRAETTPTCSPSPTPPPQDTPMWRKGWTPAGADEATTLCNACGILCVPLASPGFAPPRDFSEPTSAVRFGLVRVFRSADQFPPESRDRLADSRRLTDSAGLEPRLPDPVLLLPPSRQVQARMVLPLVRHRVPQTRGGRGGGADVDLLRLLRPVVSL